MSIGNRSNTYHRNSFLQEMEGKHQEELLLGTCAKLKMYMLSQWS